MTITKGFQLEITQLIADKEVVKRISYYGMDNVLIEEGKHKIRFPLHVLETFVDMLRGNE